MTPYPDSLSKLHLCQLVFGSSTYGQYAFVASSSLPWHHLRSV